ncbi:MAG: Gfo/Idh/MocA family oxidoreductase [Erysipelothrix sp.]|nr:Gfo/Idh/MocA family oxidoreductase [Erysipelothrix sp.]
MRIGIIGTNFVSDAMVEAANVTHKFELVVACTRRLENAEAFALKHNIENFTNKHEDLLNYDLDAVYIALPNALHKDVALFFLEHKIAVFCEKPLASNISEVLEMMKASKKYNTLLMEGIIPVYSNGIQAVRKHLDRIGTVRNATFAMNQYSSRYDAYRAGEVLNAFKPELSNGSTMDIGVYPTSVAIALFGKPDHVLASAYKLESGVDGKGTILLQYADKDVIVTHSKISNQMLKPEISGEDGVIQMNHISLMNEVIVKENKKDAEVVYADYDTPQMVNELLAFEKAYQNQAIEAYPGAHQLSIDIHEVLTEARRQTNIVFPADQ